jgi:hypothetical protein
LVSAELFATGSRMSARVTSVDKTVFIPFLLRPG